MWLNVCDGEIENMKTSLACQLCYFLPLYKGENNSSDHYGKKIY